MEVYQIDATSSVLITCTPRVELCRLYGDVYDIGKMFNIVYRRRDFDISYLNTQEPRDKERKIVEEVLRRRHSSVLEFIDTVWFIECSRVVTHELVRHRLASYWQESQRYCLVSGYLLPRSLLKEETITKKIMEIHETYMKLVEKCKRFGEDDKQLYRYIIPNAALSRIFVKMNLRELCEVFIPLRMCRRAQPEIRYIAMKMYLKITERFPILRKFTGPRCMIYGKCPEYGFTNEEEMKKCRRAGYIEALREHGTESEIETLDKILQLLP
ncbi:MAG: FAD-dependent thymidylate synthase [Crenarchaeota archaeon]|nr:FAD-dependent thymidylate synthase [Thermoproteota archaeon]